MGRRAVVKLTGGEGIEAKLRELSKLAKKRATARVGFLEGATYPDGTPVAMVAAIQNYGAPARGIPPRPFFSAMIAEKSSGWGDSLAATFRAADYDAPAALELFGEGVAGQLRQSLVDMTEPALSPVTLLLRERFPDGQGYDFSDVQQARADIAAGVQPSGAHSNPLVWSGHMLQSIGVELAS